MKKKKREWVGCRLSPGKAAREEEVHKRKKEKCIRGGRKLSTFGLVANALGLLFRAPIPSRGTLKISVILRREGGIFSLQNVMFGIQRERSCWSK